MDKFQARQIIRETFENSFDKSRFINFIKNLLNSYETAPLSYKGNIIYDAFEQYVSSMERIGKYSDGNNKIDILIVRLAKVKSIERARTMQRNFIARYLNGSRGGEMKDAALVAFVSPNDEDWRFSLVKMDYKFDEKGKVKEEFTPARRWSFLVGVNEKSHTAQSRLIPILENDELNPTLTQLEEAFNIETVTKEFFREYRDLFIKIKKELDKVVINSPKLKTEFETKGVDAINFSKKLLGQIIFLYFLQKKGWFGVPRDAKWGEGSKQFLRELLDKKHGDYKNFFNDILEPLFYDALRNDRSHDDHYYPYFTCKIPFLNGGLFDPIGIAGGYDWVKTDITLPNELFSNVSKTKQGDTGDGIFDIFDRYNFTVIEDEPLEKEVAIDPELLGKAYEKFNAIRPDNFDEYLKVLKSGKKGEESKFNKQYGVFYTPREIVHYMCRESLINYLASEFSDKTDAYQKITTDQLDVFGNKERKGQLPLESEYKPNPYISKEDIETLINYGELLGENEAVVEAKGKETETYYHKLSESIRNNAKLIDEKLAEILVCDPAVGSGAFPVGMMHEIVSARNVLSIFIKDKNRTIYKFKRDCIEKSLYGVDIDSGAVEIAKLRLWLSLVVDEDDITNIKPLPNLDYKIVQGNSLLGVEKNFFNNEYFEQLEKIKPFYFNETNPTKKQEYKKQIDELIHKISSGHKDFDFEVYFSEVFHKKGGFDIVIGNPPYGATFFNFQKKYFQNHFESAKTIPGETKGSLDSYSLFIDKGIRLCNNNSCLTYIVPLAITSSESMSSLHNIIFKTCETISISTYSNRPHKIFESADQRVAIIILQKNNRKTKNVFTTKVNKRYSDVSIQELINDLHYVNSKDYLLKGRIPKVGSQIELNILSKLFSIKTKLTDLVDKQGKHVYYRAAGGRYYNIVTNFVSGSSQEKSLVVRSEYQNLVASILSSSLYYWFLHIFSDTLHIKSYELEIMPIPIDKFNSSKIDAVEKIYTEYLKDLEKNAQIINANYNNVSSFKEYRARRSKHLIDKIDWAIKDAYDLTDEEINFIINFDLEFRTYEE